MNIIRKSIGDRPGFTLPRFTLPGFTLVELAIVLVLIAIMMGIAVYSFSTQASRMRVDSDARSLETSLQEARLRAITTNQGVGVLFARRDGQKEGTNPDSYYIFIDSNGDGQFTGGDPDTQKCEETNQACFDTTAKAGKDVVLRGPLPQGNRPGLNKGNYFSRILDDQTVQNGGTTVYYSFIFTPLGSATHGGVMLTGTEKERSICVQNHTSSEGAGMVMSRGVIIQGATGLIRLQSLRGVKVTDYECLP